MITSLLVTLLVLLILVFVFHYAQNDGIPGPLRVPIVGNLRLCVTKPSEFIYLLHYFTKTYGNAYIIYFLNTAYVHLSHPKYVAPILSSIEYITKGTPYYPMMDWLGRGLLTDSGPRWKAFRKLLTPAFHFNILQTILQVFLKNERIFIEKLKKHADGRPFDLFPIIALMSLDNITESIMGVSVNAQYEADSEYVESINKLTGIIALRIQNPLAGNDTTFKFFPQKKIYDKSLKIVQETTRRVIKLRRQALIDQNITSLGEESDFGSRNKNAFLDLLLLSELNGSKIDDESIREQVETFMFEGHDTTTSGIVFALYCISKHEDVQQKIFDEQKEILNGDLNRDPLFTELQQMKYLEMVIKESLRLYPSVPTIERLCTKDTEIGGLRIKKNTSIVINILELQRHPELFEDPLEFRPERFDVSKQSDKNFYNWLAFSAGPRNCIGQKYAMIEMKVMIACVVKHFKLLPVDEELKLCSELILRSKNGVKIMLEQR